MFFLMYFRLFHVFNETSLVTLQYEHVGCQCVAS